MLNCVSLYMTTINSVILVGFYYGFLTTFSIGPSYLFVLRNWFMQEEEEKKIAAGTGFLVGQLMMFISIYYRPLHLALGRLHIITTILVPYLFFHIFWHNHRDYEFFIVEDGSIGRKIERNFSIQCVFLNSLIFQFFNHFIFPNSTLARLVTVYMFRCKNKMLFLTSSCIAWLIGQFLILKFLSLLVVWLQEYHSYRSNKLIRNKKYKRAKWFLIMEWNKYAGQIFSVLYLITGLYYLNKVPVPLVSRKVAEETGIMSENEEKTREEIFGFAYNEVPINVGVKIKNLNLTEIPHRTSRELSFPTFLEKPLLNFFFNPHRWVLPHRYVVQQHLRNDLKRWNKTYPPQVSGAVRNDTGMSQYFLELQDSLEGEERISFTQPPILSIFSKVLRKKFLTDSVDNARTSFELFLENLDDNIVVHALMLKNELKWRIQNMEEKLFSKDFFLKVKNKKFFSWNMLQTKTRFCNDDSFCNDNSRKNDLLYLALPRENDPLLNRSSVRLLPRSLKKKRGTLKKKRGTLKKKQTEVPQSPLEQVKKLEKSDPKKQTKALTRINIQIQGMDLKKKNKLKLICKRLNQINPERKKKLEPRLRRFIKIFKNLEPGKRKELELRLTRFIKIFRKLNTRKQKKLELWFRIFIKRFRKLDSEKQKKVKLKRLKFSYFIIKNLKQKKEGQQFLKALAQKFQEELKLQIKAFRKKKRREKKGREKKGQEKKGQEFVVRKESITEKIFPKNKRRPRMQMQNPQNPRVKIKGRVEKINKKVRRWLYKLTDEIEQFTFIFRKQLSTYHEIWEKTAYFDRLYTPPTSKNDVISEFMANCVEDPLFVVNDASPQNFRRALVKGSLASRRRKLLIHKFYNPHPRSPLFLGQEDPPIFVEAILDVIYWVGQKLKLIPPDKETQEENIEEIEVAKEELKDQQEMEMTAEEKKFQIMYLWEQYPYGQALRACILLVISFYRKNILIPLLIIVKNIGRMLLFQTPEWFEDFKIWEKEKHVICLPEGLTLSEKETLLPSGWYNDGIQIKILFPFSFRTSNKGKRLPPEKDFGFLTALGTGSTIPYGEGQKRPFLFKPVLEDFKKRIVTLMNKFSAGLKRLKKRLKPFFRKLFKVFKKKEYKKEYKQEYKQILEEGFSESGSYDLSYTNNSSPETRLVSTKNLIKLVTDQKNQIINKMGPKKTNYNDKRLIRKKWQILKRINVRTICKLPRFLKVFIARIYKDKFLSSINILKMKMAIEVFISRQRKIIHKINQKSTPFTFILPREEALDNIMNSPTNSHNFDDLSYVSQAYVFYRLAKIQVNNLYKFRSFLHSQGIPLFLKPEIKDSFEKRGVVHSKWVDKKLPSYEMNQWKNWLRGHDQYNLSEISWAILKPEKWRNRIHQCHIAKNENLYKGYSYKKDQLIDSKKEKQFKGYSFLNQKDNCQKEYRYDLLSYKFLNYANANKTEYFFDRSSFQGNKNHKISSYESKKTSFFIFNNLPINIHNYIKINLRINLRGADGDRFEEKMANRKYFDWKILDFHLKPKEPKDDIQISEFEIPTSEFKIERKQQTQGFFDWMGLNEKIQKHSICDLESWFFPEFVLLYDAYQREPWLIPHKSLFLNLKINKNILNILNKKNKKKEKPSYGNLVEYVMEKSKKKDQLSESTNFWADENYNNFLADEDYKAMHGGCNILAFRRYLYQRPFELYQWSLQEDDIILTKSDRNIFLYKLLLSLRDEKKRLRLIKTLSYSRELKLEIMWDESGCVERVDLLKSGFVEIEIFLFQQNKGLLLMYQTVGLSLIHKNKHKINKKYQEQKDLSQKYLPRNHFDEAISTHQRITEKRNQNPFKFQLLVPETILSFRSRRKLRILDCFNRILLEDFLVKVLEDKNMSILTRQRTVQQLKDLRKSRITDKRNPLFWNEKDIKNSNQVSHDNKHLDRKKNQLIQLKHFLWPNYRLEDLACMNRYWFDTYNGSRFSMLRILMYPRLKRLKIFR